MNFKGCNCNEGRKDLVIPLLEALKAISKDEYSKFKSENITKGMEALKNNYPNMKFEYTGEYVNVFAFVTAKNFDKIKQILSSQLRVDTVSGQFFRGNPIGLIEFSIMPMYADKIKLRASLCE